MRDFYATAAQVIPVLLLGFVFQARYLHSVQRTTGIVRAGRRWILRVTMLASVLGELVCLVVLGHPSTPPTWAHYFVLLCVLIPLSSLAAAISEAASDGT